MGAETPQLPDGPTPEEEARARRRKEAEELDKCWDPPKNKADEPEEDLRAWNFVPGDEFILDIPEGVPAVWGEGESVGWSEGESLFTVGLPGVGKSTLAQQLLLGRLGLWQTVLGLPVATGLYNVLYLAADRPRQIARSLRRMVGEADRQVLENACVCGLVHSHSIWRPIPSYFSLFARKRGRHGVHRLVERRGDGPVQRRRGGENQPCHQHLPGGRCGSPRQPPPPQAHAAGDQ